MVRLLPFVLRLWRINLHDDFGSGIWSFVFANPANLAFRNWSHDMEHSCYSYLLMHLQPLAWLDSLSVSNSCRAVSSKRIETVVSRSQASEYNNHSELVPELVRPGDRLHHRYNQED